MQSWLDKLTDIAAIRGDEGILTDALSELSYRNGFGRFAYLHIQPGHMVAVTNYPPEWKRLYFERNYSLLDPVVKRAKSVKRMFAWSGEQDRLRLPKQERAFFAEAGDFGIRSGVTIPIKAANGSMSMFTLASDRLVTDIESDIDAVEAASAVAQLHVRMSLFPILPSAQDPSWLDPKESAYLKWIAVGKTMEEAAVLEGVKYNSVKSKLYETRKRFKIHTLSHLVALCIRAGLI